MKFSPSLLLLLFSLTMLGIWLRDTKRRHLLFLGFGFACFAAGLFVPVSLISDSLARTSPIATAFHLAGALLSCEGIMMRQQGHYPRLVGGLISICLMATVSYLSVIGSGYSRIVPWIDLALGSLFAILCVQVSNLAKGNRAERFFWSALVIFTAHFFVQSVLAAGLPSGIAQPSELIVSGYWQGLLAASPLVGALFGLGILVMSAADVIAVLQEERDCDPLTRIFNRRGLERRVERRLVETPNMQFGVIIADVDHFKAINDDLGHEAGDHVLQEFARILQAGGGPLAISGRIGGEEFLLLVRGSAAQCEAAGRSLCDRVAHHDFPMLSDGRRVTCSVGVAMARPGETLWETTSRADRALLWVKQHGRNSVATNGDEFPDRIMGVYRLAG